MPVGACRRTIKAANTSTPATPLYEKNKVLFGLTERVERFERQPLILVEGPLDAIALEQFGGGRSPAAPLTEEQAALMRRSREISPLFYLMATERAGGGAEGSRVVAASWAEPARPDPCVRG